MSKKPLKLVSLATALAALSGAAGLAATATDANANTADIADNLTAPQRATDAQPNVFIPVGEDLLGMTVTKKADGTVVADHYSHSSHASHSSHSSHYSSS
jgi:hypothetical protein